MEDYKLSIISLLVAVNCIMLRVTAVVLYENLASNLFITDKMFKYPKRAHSIYWLNIGDFIKSTLFKHFNIFNDKITEYLMRIISIIYH